MNQTVRGGENHQQVGRQQTGHERREAIIIPNFSSVTETASFSLMTGTTPRAGRVNRGVSGVEVTGMIGEVIVGEEHLGDGNVVVAEQGFVKAISRL